MIEKKPLSKVLWRVLAGVGALLILLSIFALISWFSHETFLPPVFGPYTLVSYGVALAVLFCGILLTGSSIYQFSGKKLRHLKLLPLFVGAAIIIFTLCLWNAVRETRNKGILAMVTLQAINIKEEIRARLEFEMYAIRSMANRWEVRGGTPENEWRADASMFMDYYPNFNALQRVGTDYTVNWSAPRINNAGVNSAVAKQERAVLLAAQDNNIVGITGVVNGDASGARFYLYAPVYHDDKFDGFLLGVANPKVFFDSVFSNEVEAGYAVSISQSGQVIYQAGDINSTLQQRWGKIAIFRIQGVEWNINLMPSKALMDQQGEYIPLFVLLAGIVVAFLLTILIFASQLTFRHARQLFVAHEKLRIETIGRERTEQVKVRLEKALQQSQKLEAIGTLAGGIAHDFNNILYAILGYVEMARQDLPKDSLVYTNLGKVLNAGERGRKLVASILSFSRHETHEYEPLDLLGILDVCTDLLKPAIPANIELTITKEVDEAIVYGSHVEIEQVVINIINNAVDAIKGYGHISVHLSASYASEEPLKSKPGCVADVYFCLRIKDDGAGMDDETLQRLFEPFYTTKEVGSGTGLGLSMAHGMVEAHNGIILANSVLGKGSTFYIYLPQHSKKQ